MNFDIACARRLMNCDVAGDHTRGKVKQALGAQWVPHNVKAFVEHAEICLCACLAALCHNNSTSTGFHGRLADFDFCNDIRLIRFTHKEERVRLRKI